MDVDRGSPFAFRVTAGDSHFSFFDIFLSVLSERLNKSRNIYLYHDNISISSRLGFVLVLFYPFVRAVRNFTPLSGIFLFYKFFNYMIRVGGGGSNSRVKSSKYNYTRKYTGYGTSLIFHGFFFT